MQQQQVNAKIHYLKEHWPFFVYVFLSVAALFFHECWRDEIQALLIAKAPLSIYEFFTDTLHYEGHPFLWFYLLKIFSPFGIHPLGLQILNSLLMCSTLAIFWWKFPLPKVLKSLLVFNYFFLFEFGVVARSYSLGIFLIFFYLAFRDDAKRWIKNLAFAALLLATQVSIYSLILVCALYIPHFLEQFKNQIKKTLVQTLLLVFFVAAAVLQMLPAPDQSMNLSPILFFDFDRMMSALGLIGETFLYMPALQFFPRIWPASFSDSLVLMILRTTFAFLALGYFTFSLFKKNRTLCFAFLMGAIVLIAFSYIKFIGSVRHMAHLILLMSIFYWLAQKANPHTLRTQTQNFLMGFGAWTALAGGLLYVTDVVFPFSDAKNASKVISASDKLVIGLPDYAASTLSGYLNGKEIYYLNAQRSGTYIKWNHKPPNEKLNFKATVLSVLDEYKTDEALLVTSSLALAHYLIQTSPKDILYESKNCMVPDECFLISKIRRSLLALPDSTEKE